MTKHNIMYRPGLSAIAAFAALGATPLMAQAADPLAPPMDSAPVVTSAPVVATPDAAAVPTVDPLAASATPAAKTKPSATRVTRTTTRSATATRTATVARAATPVRASNPVASSAVAPVVASPPPVAAAAPPIADPVPVAAETPVATPPTPAPATESGLPADALPIGAAGLGALALVGTALAIRRRKRRVADDEYVTTYDEPAFAADAPAAPVMAEPVPAPAEKPAMAWGTTAAVVPVATAAVANEEGEGEVPEGVDPTSHVAAAYRGPSAENPSLSLKTRLKRAAFFDQRERQAAAGEAAPLDMTAGMPDAVVEEMPDTPTETMPNAAPLSTGGSHSLRPAPEHA